MNAQPLTGTPDATPTVAGVKSRKARAVWLAWFTWVLYLAIAIATLVFQSANDPMSLLPTIFNALVFFAFATVGALIASRRPQNPIGWLLCVGTLLYAAGVLGLQYAIYTLVTFRGALPAPDWMGVLGIWLRGIGFSVLVTFVVLLFPNGHLPSPHWRAAVWLVIGAQILFTIVAWLAPATIDPTVPSIHSPVRVQGVTDLVASLLPVIFLDLLVAMGVGGASVIFRFRRAQGDERQQLKWFVYAAGVGIVTIVIIFVLFLLKVDLGAFGSALYSLAVVGFPVAVGIAILKYRLYDIDPIINRTLVYVPLTALLAGIFAASITLSQRLIFAVTGQQSDAGTAFATLITVATFDPLKTRLQTLVDRRFKEAPDATKNLRAFRDQVHSVIQIIDSQQVTRRLLDEVVRSFNAESGAIFLHHHGRLELTHTAGNWTDQSALDIPLQKNGTMFGKLSLSTRRDGIAYSSHDREILQQTADTVADALALANHVT
jgi:hypothetical protein